MNKMIPRVKIAQKATSGLRSELHRLGCAQVPMRGDDLHKHAEGGTSTLRAGGLPGAVNWDVVDATGDFVGLWGTGTNVGRKIYRDDENFGNPIYVWDPVNDYTETMTGMIGFD